MQAVGGNTLAPFAQTRNEKKNAGTTPALAMVSVEIRGFGLFQFING
jgi:hypothetical protein